MRRLFSAVLLLAGCADAPAYDVIIRGGTVYDGSGGAPVVADIAIAGDSIVMIGDLAAATAPLVVDATGLAVTSRRAWARPYRYRGGSRRISSTSPSIRSSAADSCTTALRPNRCAWEACASR
jgi:predicted amidohydrolase